MSPPDDFAAVRAMDAAAEDEAPEQPEHIPPDDADTIGLPPDCPVIPLGKSGDLCHYLDALGQHQALSTRDHTRNNLIGLYGPRPDLAWQHFPRRAQDKQTGEWVVTGFRAEIAADALMAACARRGVWSPLDRMRGAGAWAGDDGELILHVGDALLTAGREDGVAWTEGAPGQVGDHVYPTANATARPWTIAQPGGPDGPAQKVLDILKSWNWRRGELDAYLMLGFVGAAMLGGAAKWRAIVWATGDFGTGKSSMQEAVGWIFGRNGLLRSPDATAASVRQVLGYASLPVLIDEAEPGSGGDDGKMSALISLAKNAATGALSLRGGQNHQAAQFVVRSNFMFSSILVPPMSRAERSRIAVLELDPLGAREIPKGLTARAMGELGRKLLRRMVDGWWRLEETLHCYRATMAAAGYGARAQDVYGTMLAAADLLLHDSLPSSDDAGGAEAWVARLTASGLLAAEEDEQGDNQCLGFLLSSPFEAPHDRKRMPIGAWLMRAMGRMDGLDADGRSLVKRNLLLIGLKITSVEGVDYLGVANRHVGLQRLFQDTSWATREGLEGGWCQALRRIPGHIVPAKPLWFGNASRAVLIPMALCLPPSGKNPPGAAEATASPERDQPGTIPPADPWGDLDG